MVSEKELERRYATLREAMRAAGYKALVVVGNTEGNQWGYIRYVSGWRLYGGTAYVIFSLEEET